MMSDEFLSLINAIKEIRPIPKNFFVDYASYASGVSAFLVAVYANTRLIPRFQSTSNLEKDLFNFHERYMNLSEKIRRSKMLLVLNFNKTTISYNALCEMEKDWSSAANLNEEIKNTKIDLDFLFESFKSNRDAYLANRVEYMSLVISQICLCFEEINFLVEKRKNKHLSKESIKNMNEKVRNWLKFSNEEIQNNLILLDDMYGGRLRNADGVEITLRTIFIEGIQLGVLPWGDIVNYHIVSGKTVIKEVIDAHIAGDDSRISQAFFNLKSLVDPVLNIKCPHSSYEPFWLKEKETLEKVLLFNKKKTA